MKWRIAVLGTGATGIAIASRLATRDHLELLLVGDGTEQLAEDLRAAVALAPGAARVQAAPELSAASGSQVVVLADDGADARTLAARCPHAIVIVAGERVIERTASVLRETAFPRQRVIGLAGEPSAARLRSLLASELRVGPAAVNVLVLGGPGARMIVSAPPGVPKERLDDLVEHVRAADDAGAAPVLTGAAAQAVIDAITADSRRVVVCAAQCSGEYGLDGSVVAVPVVLGTPGIERIVEIELDPAQRDALHAAALA